MALVTYEDPPSRSKERLHLQIMAWTSSQSWLASLMAPTPLALTISVLLVLSTPLFLHFVIYRSTTSTTLPTFLLVGPSGSGKTSLLTLVSPPPYSISPQYLTLKPPVRKRSPSHNTHLPNPPNSRTLPPPLHPRRLLPIPLPRRSLHAIPQEISPRRHPRAW